MSANPKAMCLSITESSEVSIGLIENEPNKLQIPGGSVTETAVIKLVKTVKN